MLLLDTIEKENYYNFYFCYVITAIAGIKSRYRDSSRIEMPWFVARNTEKSRCFVELY